MRKAIVIISACVLCFFSGKAFGRSQVIHHDLRVALHPESASLTGSDMVRVRPESIDSPLFFRLNPTASIRRVHTGNRASTYSFDEGVLRVMPESSWSEEARLTIDYEATFKNRAPRDPSYTEDPGYGVSATITPQGVFLSAASAWYPEIPGSRPTFRIRIEAPAGMEAVTAGRRILHAPDKPRTTSTWEVPYPSEGLALSAGPYRIEKTEVQGISIYTFLFPDSVHLSETYLEASAGYLRLYHTLFGPYPFQKFAVVENFFPTGYGFPSYTLLGSSVIRLPFIVDTSLGHEIAHAWWGNGVRVDMEKGNWSEGLTTYVADHLYKERESAAASRRYRLNILRDYATLVDRSNDLALRAFRSRTDPATRAVGYGKGAMVFHMLRQLVGEQRFWQGLRELYLNRRFQAVSWYDFARAFQGNTQVAPQRFLRQWIETPGAPQVALEDVHAEPVESGWDVSAVLRQGSPRYLLRIPVALESTASRQERTVFLKGAATDLRFRTNAPPQRLIVDPDVDLFRRLEPEEIPPSINHIKGSASLVVVIADYPAQQIDAAAKRLLVALGQERSPVYREEALDSNPFPGKDLLYLGVPRKADLALPEGLKVSPDGFSLNGEPYYDADDVLFAVVSRANESKNVAAVFLPMSSRAARQTVRKLPHYGRYSYLAFSDGRNRDKGIWPVSASPLVHDFDLQE